MQHHYPQQHPQSYAHQGVPVKPQYLTAVPTTVGYPHVGHPQQAGGHPGSNSPYVQHQQQPSTFRENVVCYHCKAPGHYSKDCPAKLDPTGTLLKENRRVYANYKLPAESRVCRRCNGNDHSEKECVAENPLCALCGLNHVAYNHQNKGTTVCKALRMGRSKLLAIATLAAEILFGPTEAPSALEEFVKKLFVGANYKEFDHTATTEAEFETKVTQYVKDLIAAVKKGVELDICFSAVPPAAPLEKGVGQRCQRCNENGHNEVSCSKTHAELESSSDVAVRHNTVCTYCPCSKTHHYSCKCSFRPTFDPAKPQENDKYIHPGTDRAGHVKINDLVHETYVLIEPLFSESKKEQAALLFAHTQKAVVAQNAVQEAWKELRQAAAEKKAADADIGGGRPSADPSQSRFDAEPPARVPHRVENQDYARQAGVPTQPRMTQLYPKPN